MTNPSFITRPLSDGSVYVELNTRNAGRVNEIAALIEELKERAADASVPAVREVLTFANTYDKRIVGLRLSPQWSEAETYVESVDVEFLLDDNDILAFDDYRPDTPHSGDIGPSGGEIPRGLYGLYQVLIPLGITYFETHDPGCGCILEISTSESESSDTSSHGVIDGSTGRLRLPRGILLPEKSRGEH